MPHDDQPTRGDDPGGAPSRPPTAGREHQQVHAAGPVQGSGRSWPSADTEEEDDPDLDGSHGGHGEGTDGHHEDDDLDGGHGGHGEGTGDDHEDDDLDGFETPISRFVSRSRGWIAALIAVALILPAGGWMLNEYAFGTAGDAVQATLGDEAALTEALLLVRATDCAGRASSGSAFAMDLDGEPVIVTNRHVVDRARSIGVRPLDGGPALQVGSHRLATSADVAVLELADPQDVPPPLAPGTDPGEGDEVRMVGFPAARPATNAGTVDDVDGGRLLLDLVTDPGASGSPVLDADGRVVGQVFARTDDGRGVATAVGAVRQAVRTAEPAPPC